ncbi:hypothetical protein PF007_g30894 [Phytophthora fragariae]|uniref:Uncharacterized protein n=1 Tax=Phytophthora fragariae TaxID=53985 RepID=A0A6A3PLD8_9STRA|nr:hypothetical protein PF007_g30894 [Phytophthora fragariae]
MPVPGADLVCRCQLPAWSVVAGTSCRLSLFLQVPGAGLVSVLVSGLVCWCRCCRCRCQCQLPSWCGAAGTSCRLNAGARCRLGLSLPVPGADLVCRCQLPAWSVSAATSCRLSLFLPVPAAGLASVLVSGLMPVPGAGLVSMLVSDLVS